MKLNFYEAAHRKFCKYVVGVTKTRQNHWYMKEIKIYPISIKAWVAGIAYWHILETGTDNIISQNAFRELKN